MHMASAGTRDYNTIGDGSRSASHMMYVMPMFPGNTPKMLRRQAYMDLAHGVKAINWWPALTEEAYAMPGCAVDYRPVGNHSTGAMFKAMRKIMMEVPTFDDIIWDGHRATHAEVAIVFSETADIWGAADAEQFYHTVTNMGQRSAFAPSGGTKGTPGVGRQLLFIALRHAQIPVDIVLEEDIIAGEIGRYQTVFLADTHLSQAAGRALWNYVDNGGTLYGCGAGLPRDEFNQTGYGVGVNSKLTELYGVEETGPVLTGSRGANSSIALAKMDIPWAEQLDTVIVTDESGVNHSLAVIGTKSTFRPTFAVGPDSGTIHAVYSSDGSPAVVSHKVGKGTVVFSGVMPGMLYFAGAYPKRPVDRGANDDDFVPLHSISHSIRLLVVFVLKCCAVMAAGQNAGSLYSNGVPDCRQGRAVGKRGTDQHHHRFARPML